MDTKTFFDTVFLTATVVAALIASITNIAISLVNNQRLKKIENKKQINEIDKYRYSRLYELVLNWHNYDSKVKGESSGEIAFYKLLNLFLDDLGRYEIAKPLLDVCYIDDLENKKVECEKLLNDLVKAEALDGTHSKEFSFIKDRCFKNGTEFSKMLKQTINTQLEVLLRKSTER